MGHALALISRLLLLLASAPLTVVSLAQFTPGRLVILQTTTSPFSTGVPYTLREVSSTGVFGFTLTIPTTGAQQMWSDSDPHRPDINLSEEGDRLLFPGYAAESLPTNPPFPATNLAGTSGTVCPRAVGQVDASGVFTRIVTSTTLFSNTRPTAVTSIGNTIWGSSMSAASGVGVWAPGTPAVIHSDGGSSLFYNVDVHNGQLYTVRHAGPKGIYRVGTGLPVTPGQILATAIEEPGESIVVFDHKFNAAGTICYVAATSNGNGIQKWVLANDVWSMAYTFELAPGASSYRCVEVDWSGSSPVIYGLHIGAGALHRFVDNGAPSTGTVIASATGTERWTGLSWTPGTCVEGTPCDDGDPNTINDAVRGDCQCAGNSLALAARVFLEGPYVSATGLMNDALRSLPDFPLSEPFSALGLNPSGGSGTINASVLTATGNNAIVDWVLVELRDAATGTAVLMRTPALVQRDGDIVALNGTGTLRLPATSGSYRVAVRHRNHLGAMTDAALSLSGTPTVVDFTSAATTTWGTNARKDVSGIHVLWSGEVMRNAQLSYTGSANDRDPILISVGSTTPNNTLSGYRVQDVNMNGITAYTGSGNDRDPILVNVGSTTPNNLRIEQLP